MNRGREYSLWGWAENHAVLGEPGALKTLLASICRAISMTELDSLSLSVPKALENLAREPFKDEGGATAVIVLSTSHAAIHGWPDRSPVAGWFQLSVSSCRDFEPAMVRAITSSVLNTCQVWEHTHEISAASPVTPTF